MERIFIVLLVAILNYGINVYEKGDFYMEILIVRGLSSILEASLWTYFIVSVSKIISREDENLEKGKIFLLFFIILICSIIGRLTAKVFPFLNAMITYPIILISIKYILNIDWLKSITIIVSNIITLIITELISAFTCMSIFKIDSNILLTNWVYTTIALVIQYTLFFAVIKIANMISKNKNEFKDMLSSINKKTVITVLSILALCIFPQFIIYVINKYNYPTYFLILNSIQMIIVCIVIFSSFKNSMEKEKAKSDLMTITLHNKTMTGMVDGVRKLKHDYNNIMQALNGYMSTKQYDKLQAHINSVIGECSDINNLSVINPKIFNDPAIYGIVGAKYFTAIEKDIKFELDISTNIANINFSMPDLSRILGIILDNAMEATTKLEKGRYIKLEMRFDNKKCADIIRVYNTYDTSININTKDVFKKGYSSKEVKSGIGLWEVKKLIDKSGNSQIYASIEKNQFIQNIIIEK